jgi:hypothetical protein
MAVKKEKFKPLTIEDLGNFTEQVLLPAMENLLEEKLDKKLEEKLDKKLEEKLDKKFAKHTHDMKDYIDSKLASTKGDIISFIKGDAERDKNWKSKVVQILKRSKLAKVDEIKILSDLIR